MARDRTFWALLESVSLCTRFPGFWTISSFSLVIVITVNKLKMGKYVLWDIIVPMFLDKDFVRDCFVAQIHAKTCVRAGIRGILSYIFQFGLVQDHERFNQSQVCK